MMLIAEFVTVMPRTFETALGGFTTAMATYPGCVTRAAGTIADNWLALDHPVASAVPCQLMYEPV
jgi:hypothetical protein